MPKRTPVCPDQLTFDLRVKTCPDCLIEQPAWNFAKNKARKDGLQVYCSPCWNRKQREYIAGSDDYRRKRKAHGERWYRENAERLRPIRKAYYEAHADSILERGRAWHNTNREQVSARRKAHYQDNREKVRERRKAYYLENRERILAWHKAWKKANQDAVREANRAWVAANREAHNAKAHRRRARMAQVPAIPFTVEQLHQRWTYYGHKCWVCSGPATANDHVKPISKGGAHMLCNLRPICKPCNSTKHNKWPFNPEVIRCA